MAKIAFFTFHMIFSRTISPSNIPLLTLSVALRKSKKQRGGGKKLEGGEKTFRSQHMHFIHFSDTISTQNHHRWSTKIQYHL